MGKRQPFNPNFKPSEVSRKQKRKMLKKQKKQRIREFHNVSKKIIHHNVSKINKVDQKNQNKQNNNNISKNMIKNQKPNNNNFKKPQLSLNKQNMNKPQKSLTPKPKSALATLLSNPQLLKQEQQIQYYEKKLGLNKKSKQKSLAKKFGYDDDLFDFLDNISKKVKGEEKGNYEEEEYNEEDLDGQVQNSDEGYSQMDEEEQDEGNQQMQENYSENQNSDQIQEEQQENQEDEQFDDDQQIQEQQQEQGQSQMDQQQLGHYQDRVLQGFQEYFDDQNYKEQSQSNLTKNKAKQQKNETKIKQNKKIPQKSTQITVINNNNQIQKSQRPRLFTASTNKDDIQKLQIRKKMTGLFNKLSDGNLMITYRQFSQIFLSYSRSNTISVFITLFIKFNIQVQKPHLHILLSNVALSSALHHLLGNRLMAPLIYSIVQKFIELQNTEEDKEQIQQIGYSKMFQKKKNVVIILAYLYDFLSITGDFVSDFVRYLAKQLTAHNVEFLYLIIQKIGIKIRQSDPGVLKDIIDILKTAIESSKTNSSLGAEQKSKINFIQLELNELKFNRKQPQFLDQRLAFLSTFLTKNIPKQINDQKQILLLTFEQVRTADTSRTNWWDNVQKISKNGQTNGQIQQNDQNNQLLQQLTTQRKQLLQLAKSLHLVTQIRKKIFLQIMQSQDYIQATQRVLALKIKNLQQISLVLVQVCILQPTFNPFYALVACKIANVNPKFKSKVQFTIWDQLKLLQSFDARKTSNLAKFTARFISNSLTNGSLSILKNYPDLINIPPYDAMFLLIFFTEFLKVSKKQQLVQIASKLKEDSNGQIKQAILQYLNQVGIRQKGFGNMDKMKFLRKVILVNDQQKKQENGEF